MSVYIFYQKGTVFCVNLSWNKNKGWLQERSDGQVSLKRLALRLFSFRYTSVPSKILWKSCFGNCFFLGLIAESQLRKVRKASSLSTKFLENNFCTNYFTLVFSGYQISTFVGLFFGAIFKRLNKMLKTAASPIKINQSCAFWTLSNLVRTLACSFVENSPLEGDLWSVPFLQVFHSEAEL